MSDLKIANESSRYKKKQKTSGDDYRPVNTLSNISKIYEMYV